MGTQSGRHLPFGSLVTVGGREAQGVSGCWARRRRNAQDLDSGPGVGEPHGEQRQRGSAGAGATPQFLNPQWPWRHQTPGSDGLGLRPVHPRAGCVAAAGYLSSPSLRSLTCAWSCDGASCTVFACFKARLASVGSQDRRLRAGVLRACDEVTPQALPQAGWAPGTASRGSRTATALPARAVPFPRSALCCFCHPVP